MPGLDVENLIVKPTDQSGLYHIADNLEKNQYKQAELAQQQQARKAATATYLTNLTDKKDYLSGTTYDPIIVKSLQGAMQQGMQLVDQGASASQIAMALGPSIAKINDYSVKAKLIDQNIKDGVGKLKQYTGYNPEALSSEAKKAAFYDDKGQLKDIDQVDPNTDWIGNVIKNNPDKVITAQGLDEFAKNTPMSKAFSDITTYDANGAKTKIKAHLTGQNWLVPEVDNNGVTTGLVPKHDIATENGNPLLHTFTDENGKETKAPVRLLDEGTFDNMMQQRPDVADFIRSQVKQHIGEYTGADGKTIDIGSPQAKMVARAFAYDDLNRRKTASIEHVADLNKPTSQQLNIRMYNDPSYINAQRNIAEARTEGRLAGKGAGTTNAVQTIGEIFNHNPDFLNVQTVEKNGRNVLDVTGDFPKGGILPGKGDAFKYKGIYYDPEKQQMIVDKVGGTAANPTNDTEVISAADAPKFMARIATANGVPINKVRDMLAGMGYKNGSFSGAAEPPPIEQPKVANPVNDYLESGDAEKLKGIKTPDGKIEFAGERSGFNPKKWFGGSYKIEFKGGKTLPFKDKAAMDDYLKKNNPVKTQSTVSKKAILD